MSTPVSTTMSTTVVAPGDHPGLVPYTHWLSRGRCLDLSALNGLARECGLALPDGRPLVFVASRSRMRALDYERRVAEHGEIATRDGSLHDGFNALAWLRFPRTKAALNAVHLRASEVATGNARCRARDAATLIVQEALRAGRPLVASRTGESAGVSQDLLFRRQLECYLVASHVLGTTRIRVPDGLHFKCFGSGASRPDFNGWQQV
jgi:hypothetical protein